MAGALGCKKSMCRTPQHAPGTVWPLCHAGMLSVINRLLTRGHLTAVAQAGALVHAYTDGTVLVTHGGVEMGQGLHTKMAQVCAALKVPGCSCLTA